MIAKYVGQNHEYDLSDKRHISNQPEYRLWIYEYALKKFEDDTEYKKCTGICAEIVKYIREEGGLLELLKVFPGIGVIDEYPELKKYKPITGDTDWSWWPMIGLEWIEYRIRVLKNCIEEVKLLL